MINRKQPVFVLTADDRFFNLCNEASLNEKFKRIPQPTLFSFIASKVRTPKVAYQDVPQSVFVVNRIQSPQDFSLQKFSCPILIVDIRNGRTFNDQFTLKGYRSETVLSIVCANDAEGLEFCKKYGVNPDFCVVNGNFENLEYMVKYLEGLIGRRDMKTAGMI